ncbi:MAG: DNA topoisomerase IV subunit B [Chloroflexi bacterium]|nr:DNA topoisomerase IV subunit B [Chloroflexota bacterium]
MAVRYSADQIVELEFLEAVRRRPGMYIGNNNLHGLHHILLEVLDNSVDEAMMGYATTIQVIIAKDGSVTVTDDGRGIPVEYKPESGMSALTQVLLKPHAGGKFGGDGAAYSSSGGLHGIGIKTTNAFSEYLEVEVCRYGLVFRQRFENGGHPVTPVEIFDSTGEKVGEVNENTNFVLDKRERATALEVNKKKVKVSPDTRQVCGTTFRFRPNRAWFSKDMEWPNPETNVPWDAERLDTRFRQIAHLYPGVCIEFTDLRQAGAEKRVYYSKNGLVDYLGYLNDGVTPLHKPIVFKDRAVIDTEAGKGKGNIEVEIALQYAGEETQIYSFVNAIPTPLGGTHVAAFKAGLTKAVKQFATTKKLIKGEDDVRGDDALLGLTAIIKVTMTGTPQFLSQTKESLTSPEVHGPVLSATYGNMIDFLEKNIPTGKLIVNQALAAARGREAASQARKLVIRKSAMDAGEYVLGKLADIQRRGGNPVVPLEHTALYLVEGDSAGGSCKQGRDSRYHAILPLRGKIPNVEKMNINEILKNREIAAIVAAVGTGVGADCDVSQMRYGRISVLVDADVDGSHIATLLSTLFWRVMRPVIEAGRFYIARPPLYMLRNTKTKETRYAYSDEERKEIEQLFGPNNYTIQRYKGLGEMNPEQLRETIFVIPDSAAGRQSKRGRSSAKSTANGKHASGHDEKPGVLAEGHANGSGAAERVVTVDDFTQRDVRMVIEDVHRTRTLIEQLMGADVGPRKKWLMKVDWTAEE